jgi:sterol 3beta-glucosyltransferase
MRVCVTAIGTHGDVLPMLALAARLKKAHHEVRFATAQIYESQVRAAGVEFYPIEGAPDSFFGGQGGAMLREMTKRPRQFQRFWNLCMGPYARRHLRETWGACKGFDTAVCLPWFHAAPSLSEKLGAPCFATTVMPVIGLPTSEIPNPMAENHRPDLSGPECRRTWRTSTLIAAAPRDQINEWRTQVLGLRPLSGMGVIRAYRHTHFLLSYSQSILPRPQDWPSSVHVTGFWFLEEPGEWQPSDGLARFLDHHAAPLMVGFSSQVARDPAAFTEKVTRAVVRSGKSAILLTGWGGLRQTDLPNNILIQQWAPYDWIVPRLSGFLHHGGCGSMAMCLRHGIPSMAIPFGFDQALWGTRIARLGLGPAPMDPENIDVNVLAESLVRMTEDGDMKQRARQMADKIRQEDGVGAAVGAIETALGVSRRAQAG